MRDTYDIMAHLEYLLHDTSASMWNTAKKLDAINNAYDQIINRCIEVGENFFYAETTLTAATSGTQDWEYTAFDFPVAPSRLSKILMLTDENGYQLHPINLVQRDYAYPIVSAKDVELGYWLGHDKIYINSDGWTGTPRLYYVKRPSLLQLGTAEAGADTTMTLDADTYPSIENDYYNGQTFTIRSGTGAGEEATASDYVGSTRVLTIDFTSTPSTDSVYASVPEVPRGHLEVIACGAAIRALMFDVAQAEKLKTITNWYTKLEYDLIDFIKTRVQQKSRRVLMNNMD